MGSSWRVTMRWTKLLTILALTLDSALSQNTGHSIPASQEMLVQSKATAAKDANGMAGMDAMAAMAAKSKQRKAVTEGQSMAAGSDGVMKVRPGIWNDVETPHGSFWGHVVPGSAFIAAGIRWFMQYGVEEFGLDRAGGLKRAGEQYKPRALHTRTDFAMWAFFLTIGTMGEVHNGHFFSGDTSHMVYATLAEHNPANHDYKHVHSNVNNVQHIAMYMSFLITAIVQLLETRYPAHIPQYAGASMLTISFLINTMQWYIHSNAKPQPHCMQHMMFAIISLSMAAVTFLEIKRLDRRGLAARAYLSILNGIWFYVMAMLMEYGWTMSVEYRPKTGPIEPYTDMDLPEGVMMMMNCVLFTSIAVALLLTMFCIIGFIKVKHGYASGAKVAEYEPIPEGSELGF